MKRIFVDTSAWYAYVRRDDPDHLSIKQALEKWEDRLVTSNFIFDELVTLTKVRLGHAVAVAAGDALKNGVAEVVSLLPEDEEDAWTYFKRHRDKGYSFTDCSSFALMHRLRIPLALTTDHHFAQAGFDVQPESS